MTDPLSLILLLKLIVTPALIAATTLLARRFGPGVGGAAAGLPLTSAPVSVFLAIEHGPAFAATAAAGTLLGLLSQAALCMSYSWTARRAAWPISACVGVGSFLGMTVALERVPASLGLVFASVCALLILAAVLVPAPRTLGVRVRSPAWDLPLRMLVATTIVVALTTIAPVLGPRWTGLLSPFPVFALVLGTFTHRTESAAAAAHLLRGIVLGSLAHAVMFVLIGRWLPSHGLVWTYAWASVAALAVNGLALWIVGRTESRPDRVGVQPAGAR